jgi:hypothetical protein
VYGAQVHHARRPEGMSSHALRCTELAERATDSQLKAVLKHLAQRWVKLAVELERAQALRDAIETKPKKR